jgi:Cof subfamily protein (haloacid dehalogenase superfamily)
VTIRPKLIATDLDGTIVHDDGSVSRRTLSALHAAMDAGIRVVFVTGRPPRWMRPVAEATGHSGVGVCANGAYVYDMQTETVVETFAMKADVATVGVNRVRKAIPGVAFAVETSTGFAHEPEYQPRWDTHEPLGIGPVETFFDRVVVKLLARADGTPGDEMLRAASPVLKGILEVTHSNVNDSLLELSALGVNKATTLAMLAQRWGVAREEVIAFGDMPNDAELLRWAGRGYAVGNAHAHAIAAADEHAPSIHEDGVAQVIEGILRDF